MNHRNLFNCGGSHAKNAGPTALRLPANGLFAVVGCLVAAFAPAAFGLGGGAAPPKAASSESSSNGGSMIWRVPENDGINCLYLQLRILGYRKSYEAFREMAPDGREYKSMSSLCALASRCGYNIVPVRLTTAELRKLRSPVIVHMEEAGPESGRFALMQACSEDFVTMVDGRAVRRVLMRADEFQRSWTRYALAYRSSFGWAVLARRLGALGLLLYVAVLMRGAPRAVA